MLHLTTPTIVEQEEEAAVQEEPHRVRRIHANYSSDFSDKSTSREGEDQQEEDRAAREPNFELYHGNSSFSHDRVQIKVMKGLKDKKRELQDTITQKLDRVKAMQRFFSSGRHGLGLDDEANEDQQPVSATFRLHEHLVANEGNLYLTSEPVNLSLLEKLEQSKQLIESNKRNEMVSILLLENMLTILHGLTNFHVGCIEEADGCEHVDINIEQVHFNFDGKLKYCPELLSPMHNFPRLSDLN